MNPEHDLEGTSPATGPLLRHARASDIPIFYEQQRDPVAVELAAFPARERDAFEVHWQKIMADPRNWVRTIESAGAVCGYVTAFQLEGVWEIGYWLGREHWGKGLATRAVAEFLAEFRERPLYATVVVTNQPSVRVLEKCGFRRIEGRVGDDGLDELHLALER
jgi:RimJ/RimL family protein N-acetyltransferase